MFRVGYFVFTQSVGYARELFREATEVSGIVYMDVVQNAQSIGYGRKCELKRSFGYL